MKKSNFIYLYDGTFIELLNLIYDLYKNKIIPKNIKKQTYTPTLFEQTIQISITNDEKIIQKIINCFNKNIFNTLYLLYLSNDENKEILMFYFLGYAEKYKMKVYNLRTGKIMPKILKITKYIKNENHKYKGFLRFKELENKVLYAQLSPENNILPILVPHFKERLKNEYWIINDTKRKIYALYDKKEIYFINEEDLIINKDYSHNEEEIQDLWKTFYKTIGIKERKNDRCRMNFMPKRYWKYLIEMSDEIEENNN